MKNKTWLLFQFRQCRWIVKVSYLFEVLCDIRDILYAMLPPEGRAILEEEQDRG